MILITGSVEVPAENILQAEGKGVNDILADHSTFEQWFNPSAFNRVTAQQLVSNVRTPLMSSFASCRASLVILLSVERPRHRLADALERARLDHAQQLALHLCPFAHGRFFGSLQPAIGIFHGNAVIFIGDWLAG